MIVNLYLILKIHDSDLLFAIKLTNKYDELLKDSLFKKQKINIDL